MSVGLSAYAANAFLDALGNNVSFSITAAYIQLHVGDPGAAGTTSVAIEATRKPVSFGVASGGAISNDVAVEWTNIAGSQDATHFSLWSASTAGTFLASGLVTANPYTAGDTYTIAVGDLDLSLAIAN